MNKQYFLPQIPRMDTNCKKQNSEFKSQESEYRKLLPRIARMDTNLKKQNSEVRKYLSAN